MVHLVVTPPLHALAPCHARRGRLKGRCLATATTGAVATTGSRAAAAAGGEEHALGGGCDGAADGVADGASSSSAAAAAAGAEWDATAGGARRLGFLLAQAGTLPPPGKAGEMMVEGGGRVLRGAGVG